MQKNGVIRVLPGYIIIASFLLASFSSHSQTRKYPFLPKDNKRLKYQSGLPNFEFENAYAEAAKKFNFSYYRVGGCTLEQKFSDHCDKHNKRLYRRLEQEFGTSWKKEFEQESVRLYKLFRLADTMLMQHPTFWDREISIANGDMPLRHFQETDKDSVLLVTICLFNDWYQKMEPKALYQFEFNLVSKELTEVPVKTNTELLSRKE